MNRYLIAVSTAVLFSLGTAVFAGDEELCLDCHEPAEDWEGMSAEDVLANATDTSIKRHADNAEFSEAQLQVIIATLLGGAR